MVEVVLAIFGHQRFGEFGHADEGMAGNIHRHQETFFRTIGHTPMQISFWSKRNGMKQKIKCAPLLPDGVKQGLHLRIVLHIAGHNNGSVQLFCKWPHIGLGFIIEIGYRELCACLVENAGAAIRNAMIVGDAENQTFFPAKSSIAVIFSYKYAENASNAPHTAAIVIRLQ